MTNTLISADTVIIDDNGIPSPVTDHAILVKKGLITHILPTEEALKTLEIDEHIALARHILMPGLINTHGHAAMSLLRGYSDDKPLMNWLEEDIWPAEQQWVSEEFVKDGTTLAIAEMLLSGTTCFSDMYFFPEITAQVVHQTGIRAQVTFPVFDFPSNWGNGPDDYINKGLQLYDTYKNNSLISIAFGPHAPYTVSDAPLKRIATLSNEIEAHVQIHLHETAQEVENAIQQTGKRPIERLYDLGLLNSRTQCVHMTELNEEDISLLKASNAHVIHCPQSNQKLASGICPTHLLQDNNINVALGTDSAASNNNLNLFSELKSASLQAKTHSNNAATMDAATSLNMATLNGAKALGIEHLCGSICIGKQADIIAIDTNTVEMQPLYNPLSQLVYTSPKVNHVWVNGKQLVKDQQLLTINLQQVLNTTQSWARKINK